MSTPRPRVTFEGLDIYSWAAARWLGIDPETARAVPARRHWRVGHRTRQRRHLRRNLRRGTRRTGERDVSEPNKYAIREWVSDLRSGNFKQGQGQLRKGDEFCCLGVACETHRRVVGGGEWEGATYDTGLDRGGALLPLGVVCWLGMSDSNPKILRPDGSTTSCGDANDREGFGFAAIADALERTYLQ